MLGKTNHNKDRSNSRLNALKYHGQMVRGLEAAYCYVMLSCPCFLENQLTATRLALTDLSSWALFDFQNNSETNTPSLFHVFRKKTSVLEKALSFSSCLDYAKCSSEIYKVTAWEYSALHGISSQHPCIKNFPRWKKSAHHFLYCILHLLIPRPLNVRHRIFMSLSHIPRKH